MHIPHYTYMAAYVHIRSGMKKGFIFLFVCTRWHPPLKVDFNKLYCLQQTQLALSFKTQMVSYFHSFYCRIAIFFLIESKLFLIHEPIFLMMEKISNSEQISCFLGSKC